MAGGAKVSDEDGVGVEFCAASEAMRQGCTRRVDGRSKKSVDGGAEDDYKGGHAL